MENAVEYGRFSARHGVQDGWRRKLEPCRLLLAGRMVLISCL